MAAAGVNPIDFKTRGAQGGVPRWAVTLPKIPGGDVAGVVVEADAGSKVACTSLCLCSTASGSGHPCWQPPAHLDCSIPNRARTVSLGKAVSSMTVPLAFKTTCC